MLFFCFWKLNSSYFFAFTPELCLFVSIQGRCAWWIAERKFSERISDVWFVLCCVWGEDRVRIERAWKERQGVWEGTRGCRNSFFCCCFLLPVIHCCVRYCASSRVCREGGVIVLINASWLCCISPCAIILLAVKVKSKMKEVFWCLMILRGMTHSARKMLIYSRKRGEGLKQTDGWLEPLRLLLPCREELICFVQRPRSPTLPYSSNNSSFPPCASLTHSLPPYLFCFFPSSSRRLHVFSIHMPHCLLPVRWNGREQRRRISKCTCLQGGMGTRLQGGLQSCSNQ